MNCPHCGMPHYITRGDCEEYECGSLYGPSSSGKNDVVRLCDSLACTEIARLKDRVRVLEEAIERAQKFSVFDGAAYEILEQALAGGKEEE